MLKSNIQHSHRLKKTLHPYLNDMYSPSLWFQHKQL